MITPTFILLVTSLIAPGTTSCPATVNAGSSHETTASFPSDSFGEAHQKWPLPIKDMAKDIIAIEAEFVESREVLSVSQGNFRTITYLVKYKPTKKNKEYPYEELAFIANDIEPAKGSGILSKKLAWPFEAGTKTFYLKKDKSCNFKAYFEVFTYSR